MNESEPGPKLAPFLSGFEMVGYADFHFRLDDELRFEVGRRTVTGNTDRFTLLSRQIMR